LEAEHRKPAIRGIIAWVVLYLAGGALNRTGHHVVGDPLMVLGIALLLWGAFHLTKGKGYSPWLCLVALVPILGIIALLLVPDRRPAHTVPESSGAGVHACGQCGHGYHPNDYRVSASVWRCSRCQAELPHPSTPAA
jgi:hypothetical protein